MDGLEAWSGLIELPPPIDRGPIRVGRRQAVRPRAAASNVSSQHRSGIEHDASTSASFNPSGASAHVHAYRARRCRAGHRITSGPHHGPRTRPILPSWTEAVREGVPASAQVCRGDLCPALPGRVPPRRAEVLPPAQRRVVADLQASTRKVGARPGRGLGEGRSATTWQPLVAASTLLRRGPCEHRPHGPRRRPRARLVPATRQDPGQRKGHRRSAHRQEA
jgi:hypothetical protein